MRNVVKATGEERWLLNKTTAIRGEDGQVTGVVNVIEDVTQAKRVELAQRLLAEASDALASSLDYESTLQRVAEVAVPSFADWCGVDVPGPGGFAQLVAIAHMRPREGRAREADARPLPGAARSRGGDRRGRCAASRASSAPRSRDEELRAYAQDEQHFEMLRVLGMASVVVVPLVAGGQTLGTLILARSNARAPVRRRRRPARRRSSAGAPARRC